MLLVTTQTTITSLNCDYLFQERRITDFDEKNFNRACEAKVQL